jgi:hypothetical protein
MYGGFVGILVMHYGVSILPIHMEMNWDATSQIKSSGNYSQNGQFHSQVARLHTNKGTDVGTCGLILRWFSYKRSSFSTTFSKCNLLEVSFCYAIARFYYVLDKLLTPNA